MMRVWHGLKISISISLVVGLLFSGGLFCVILYARITGSDLDLLAPKMNAQAYASAVSDQREADSDPNQDAAQPTVPPPRATQAPPPETARLSAPAQGQYPELPAGCEVTSLSMLLEYAGIDKDKMQLVQELTFDPTPVRYDKAGNIAFWGNPNTGFVGDVTRHKIGFGVYHSGLIGLLKKYVPTAVDMTGGDFSAVEKRIAEGVPVMVWTTTNFQVPQKWVEWDTPIGPIRTTFSEHAVLMVGYDRDNVYVNDPLSGKKDMKIDKQRFVATWKAMGKQALSYDRGESQI